MMDSGFLKLKKQEVKSFIFSGLQYPSPSTGEDGKDMKFQKGSM
jgi:hypothetical protein